LPARTFGPEDARALLCALQDDVRAALLADRATVAQRSAVTGSTDADVIYAIDRVADAFLLEWFAANWPATEPVEIVSESSDDAVVHPAGTPLYDARWTCILDPIDGTRGLMYDKRPAWSLAAVAPRRGTRPRLRDVVAAAMTELPVAKQWASDQFSAVRGCGRGGIVATRTDVRSPRLPTEATPLAFEPSPVHSFEHGFASFSRFLPAARPEIAAFEDAFWRGLYGDEAIADLPVFEDQYLSTAGQFHELLVGHDRMLGDVRPLAFAAAGVRSTLACHPYDCCTALVLEEAGCVVTSPWGTALDAPLDTTTPVAWVGFANRALADLAAPALRTALRASFPSEIPDSEV
jgi:fructose-1,6-bisphosphatase/inositol monophosphatase family enzyme